MRKFQQVFLALFGITAIFISMLHVALGPAAIPGSVPVNATMDSEDRFYATLFLAYGAVLVWCVREVEHKSKPVYFLALTLFTGGLARLVSMAAVGPPNAFFVAMTALELSLPIVMALVQRKCSPRPTGA
jgi:hypothetical protein